MKYGNVVELRKATQQAAEDETTEAAHRNYGKCPIKQRKGTLTTSGDFEIKLPLQLLQGSLFQVLSSR